MTNFTIREIRALSIVCSQEFELNLVACLIDGEPGVALAAVKQCDDGRAGVLPLFVSFKEGTKFDFFGESGAEVDDRSDKT